MRGGLWLLVCLCCWAAAAGCGRSEQAAAVPWLRVKKQDFARVVEADGHLRPLLATPVTLPPEAPWALRITWLAPDGSLVKKGDPVVRFSDLELREQLASAESDRQIAAAQKHKEQELLRFASADRQRNIVSAQRELDLTRLFPRKDAEIFSKDDIIEGEIDGRLKEVMLRFARESEPEERRVGRDKVAVSAVDERKAEELKSRAQKGLLALSIAAEHDGVFTVKRNGTSGGPMHVGDTVYRGQPVAELALLDKLEVEVFVLELEAAGLSAGRKAEVIIESQPQTPFAAQVKQVESVTRRRQQQSPVQYFGVVLTLSRTVPELMKPGQRVRARLFLNEQKDALVVPRPALFERDGHPVVYRQDRGGQFLPVQVVLGPATAGLLTVESGLHEGDVIALRDPGKAADESLPGAVSSGGAGGASGPSSAGAVAHP